MFALPSSDIISIFYLGATFTICCFKVEFISYNALYSCYLIPIKLIKDLNMMFLFWYSLCQIFINAITIQLMNFIYLMVLTMFWMCMFIFRGTLLEMEVLLQ